MKHLDVFLKQECHMREVESESSTSLREEKNQQLEGELEMYHRAVLSHNIPVSGSSRAIEMRIVPRQNSKDLRCDKVGPASDSRSYSTREMKIKALLLPHCCKD